MFFSEPLIVVGDCFQTVAYRASLVAAEID